MVNVANVVTYMEQLRSLYDSNPEIGKCIQNVYNLILAYKKSLSLCVCSANRPYIYIVFFEESDAVEKVYDQSTFC